MLGSAEEWFYRGLGGINVDLARHGAERLAIHPFVSAKIAWVRTRYQSALGTVVSNWRRGTTRTEYHVEIPPNTTATITLETASPGTVMVNGAPVTKCGGVLAVEPLGGKVKMTLPAGPEGWPQGGPRALAAKQSEPTILRLTLASGSYRLSATNPLESLP